MEPHQTTLRTGVVSPCPSCQERQHSEMLRSSAPASSWPEPPDSFGQSHDPLRRRPTKPAACIEVILDTEAANVCQRGPQTRTQRTQSGLWSGDSMIEVLKSNSLGWLTAPHYTVYTTINKPADNCRTNERKLSKSANAVKEKESDMSNLFRRSRVLSRLILPQRMHSPLPRG
ncbi:hypothetical protein VTK56DRAFT_5140 [Thermocarpiscus australiensis]